MTHNLASGLKLLPLLPLAAFALSGCTTTDRSAAAGPGTIVTVSHQPYKDLKAGHYNEARDGFSQDFAKYPDDPYVQLDLGLAYQMLGRMDQAEPLYRKALVGGGNIVPADTTTKQSLGLNIASIACDNLKAGLKDPNACGAAAPPPPPPPPMVKTFIVFFDFNKSNLTAEAQQVVASAVKTAKDSGAVRIMITGHTDTVGSHSYNQRLSERRAQSTKDEMVRQGMDANEIMTAGKSFDDPLVPTGPGVREPQNRRAVIDLGAGAGT